MPSPTDPPPDRTSELLGRFHDGDDGALEALVRDNLEWLHDRVRRRLGQKLRAKADSQDIVQDAMVEILRYAPRFRCASRNQFRALMGRIVENVIRDQNDFFSARRRAMSQEAGDVGMVTLDGLGGSATAPDRAMERNESQARLRLALELLDPADREVIVLRQWEGLEFAEIGNKLGINANAARMRFQRALPRLADRMDELD